MILIPKSDYAEPIAGQPNKRDVDAAHSANL